LAELEKTTRHEQLNRRSLDLVLLLVVVIFVFVVNISVMCIHSEAISSRVNKECLAYGSTSLLPAVDGGIWCVSVCSLTVIQIFGYSAIFCLPILIPVAATSRNNAVTFQMDPNQTYEGFDNLAMGNVEVSWHMS
jgi:hypothetical protein